MEWDNGDHYDGEWQHGEKKGQGTYTWADGDKYAGWWVQGKKHGKGKFTWAKGPYKEFNGECVADSPVAGELIDQWETIYDVLLDGSKGFSEMSFSRKVEKKVIQRLVRVMVVGHGGGGKSTLIKRLQEGCFKPDLGITDGVTMEEFSLRNGCTSVNVRTWDFGGQPVYMATNPFFFAVQSLFLVVWNPRVEQDMMQAVGQYMDTIQCRLGTAPPVIFVSTNADQGCAPTGVDAALQRYGGTHVHVSSLNGSGMSRLRQLVFELAIKMPHVGMAVPKSFFKFEKIVLNQKHPYGAVPLTTVFQIGKERCGFDDPKVKEALKLLATWGSVLHFENDHEALQQLVFVNPKELSRLMATAVTCNATKQGAMPGGILLHDPKNLAKSGGKQPPPNHILLALLHVTEVAYPLPCGEKSLVPAMLPEKEPTEASTWLNLNHQYAALKIVLSHLPPDLFPRLLVRTARFSKMEGSWKHGALLSKGSSHAIVRIFRKSMEIRVECTGSIPGDSPLVIRAVVYHTLERLLECFPGVQRSEIYAGCPSCRKWACSAQELALRLERAQPHLECRECIKQVDVSDLLPGIAPVDKATIAVQSQLRQLRTDATSDQREVLRRDVLRMLHDRLNSTEGADDDPGPLLWTPVKRASSRPGWHVRALCEHPAGWHPPRGELETDIGRGEGVVESISSDYMLVVAEATQQLCCRSAGSKQIVDHDTDAAHVLLGSEVRSLIRNLYQQAGGCDGCGLRRVDVADGPALWLCEGHAMEVRRRVRSELVLPGELAPFVQWMHVGTDGQMVAYDPEHNGYLEAAYQRGDSELVVIISGNEVRRVIFTAAEPADCIFQKNRLPGPAVAARANGYCGVHFEEDVRSGFHGEALRRVFFPQHLRLPDGCLIERCTRVAVEPNSKLWKRMSRRIRLSLPEHRVTSMEKVLNRFLWDRYCVGSWQIAMRNQGLANERELFHWSKDVLALVEGSSGAGLDHRMKQPAGCEYGNGIYFAEQAAYSVAYGQGWLFKGEAPRNKPITLVVSLVSLGDCHDFGPHCSSSRGVAIAASAGVAPGLKDWWDLGVHRNRGPRKNHQDPRSELYDSVTGTEADMIWSECPLFREKGKQLGRQYVVFDAGQSYPYLLITLELPDLPKDSPPLQQPAAPECPGDRPPAPAAGRPPPADAKPAAPLLAGGKREFEAGLPLAHKGDARQCGRDAVQPHLEDQGQAPGGGDAALPEPDNERMPRRQRVG